MKINIEKGDLFDLSQKYALVHCISLDCAMAGGIAVAFVKKFPPMKPYLLNIIKENNYNYPCSILYDKNNRKVINMITKEKCYHRPTYKDFIISLKEVKEICLQKEIKFLGLPKIGCGIDGLNWNIVLDLIKGIFSDTDIEIEIRYI